VREQLSTVVYNILVARLRQTVYCVYVSPLITNQAIQLAKVPSYRRTANRRYFNRLIPITAVHWLMRAMALYERLAQTGRSWRHLTAMPVGPATFFEGASRI